MIYIVKIPQVQEQQGGVQTVREMEEDDNFDLSQPLYLSYASKVCLITLSYGEVTSRRFVDLR